MPTTVSFSNAGLEAHCRALQDTLDVSSIDDLLVLDSGELRGAGLDNEAQATLFEALRQRQLQLQTAVESTVSSSDDGANAPLVQGINAPAVAAEGEEINAETVAVLKAEIAALKAEVAQLRRGVRS